MATPEEQKARELRDLNNRSGEAALPIPDFQFESFPPEILKAFPSMEGWLRRQNGRIAEHWKKMNVILVRT
jgi:hypothetical protein